MKKFKIVTMQNSPLALPAREGGFVRASKFVDFNAYIIPLGQIRSMRRDMASERRLVAYRNDLRAAIARASLSIV